MDLMVKMCCDEMKANAYCVDENSAANENGAEDKPVYFSSKFNEYGLPVYDGENGEATSYILIGYCPWCGAKLPESRREEWFDRLEALGFDAPLDDIDSIPHEFKTYGWWQVYETQKERDKE
ncbi:MAG: hypothetical protein IKM61_00165 [Eubacteriaceae bacterium]|nr:hypothetical protein [Clostridia bacterium]MBR6800151.1 hypothetical protein [Eubacteriaceae bacterium]